MSATATLVTGALGCIGAWVVRLLVEREERAVVFDLGDDRRRLVEVMGAAGLVRVEFLKGDVTDGEAVREALRASRAARIVHLAGLQVPFCRADPVRGARVNVVGTLNVFEAARSLELERVVYASSAAVYGPDDGPLPDETTPCHPTTHYGAYKRANEESAAVYWNDAGLSSVGLRPLTVYGVGRDQGMTSAPTSAMKAAVLGRAFHVPFGGATDFNYARDAAEAFLACAARAAEGAHVYNLPGESLEIAAVLETIASEAGGAQLTFDGTALPLPPKLDGSAFTAAYPELELTSFVAGVQATLERFRELHETGRLHTGDLDR